MTSPWEKNWPPWLLTVSSRWAHRELTVTKMVTASRDWAVTWAVIELWPSRDWAVIILKMPWLSCDLAVTELWPSRDLAATELWALLAVIIGPRSRDHRDNYFLMGHRAACVPTLMTRSTYPWSSSLETGVYGRMTSSPFMRAVR